MLCTFSHKRRESLVFRNLLSAVLHPGPYVFLIKRGTVKMQTAIAQNRKTVECYVSNCKNAVKGH